MRYYYNIKKFNRNIIIIKLYTIINEIFFGVYNIIINIRFIIFNNLIFNNKINKIYINRHFFLIK